MAERLSGLAEEAAVRTPTPANRAGSGTGLAARGTAAGMVSAESPPGFLTTSTAALAEACRRAHTRSSSAAHCSCPSCLPAHQMCVGVPLLLTVASSIDDVPPCQAAGRGLVFRAGGASVALHQGGGGAAGLGDAAGSVCSTRGCSRQLVWEGRLQAMGTRPCRQERNVHSWHGRAHMSLLCCPIASCKAALVPQPAARGWKHFASCVWQSLQSCPPPS